MPFRDVVQDLFGTDPTQETCATLNHAGDTSTDNMS